MATTTKTLTPTNQTITLPDMTERPNASVLVDGIGKDADAINALSEQIANSQVEFTAANVHANVSELQYKVLKKNKSVGHIEVFMLIGTQIPAWTKVFDVNEGMNVLGDHNFTVVDYDNPSKEIWLYLYGDSLFTHDALPGGRYVVSETFMRNTSV